MGIFSIGWEILALNPRWLCISIILMRLILLCEAVERLKTAGVNVLNQSVLLRAINDNCEQLVALSEKLFDSDVMPTICISRSSSGRWPF